MLPWQLIQAGLEGGRRVACRSHSQVPEKVYVPWEKKRLLALQSATAVTWPWHSLLPGGVANQPATPTTASPQHREWLHPQAVQNSFLSRRRGGQMDREGLSCFWKAPFLPKSTMSHLCLCLCLARTCPSLSDDPNLSRAVSHHLHNPCSPLPKHWA